MLSDYTVATLVRGSARGCQHRIWLARNRLCALIARIPVAAGSLSRCSEMHPALERGLLDSSKMLRLALVALSHLGRVSQLLQSA